MEEKKDKVCMSTYIWGDRYQGYVPIAIYSIHKMYPDYDVVLFLHDKLSPNLKNILKKFDLLDHVIIRENVFNDCPNMNSNKAMAFRWVLWDDVFLKYDYLYIIDIDMFYIKEPLDLHLQHKYHMDNITHMPFDNMRRVIPIKSISLKQHFIDTAVFVKNFGIRYLPSFIINRFHDIRMLSGLHFIDVKPYFKIFTPNLIEKYKEKIYDNSYIKGLNTVNNEAFLYKMLKDVGFDVDKLAAQDFAHPFSHMDFNNYNKPLFRPTHGIHMGSYRIDYGNRKADLSRVTYAERYYRDYMNNNLIEDSEFKNFLNSLNEDAKIYFRRYFKLFDLNIQI